MMVHRGGEGEDGHGVVGDGVGDEHDGSPALGAAAAAAAALGGPNDQLERVANVREKKGKSFARKST